jgi:hypothetical protein
VVEVRGIAIVFNVDSGLPESDLLGIELKYAKLQIQGGRSLSQGVTELTQITASAKQESLAALEEVTGSSLRSRVLRTRTLPRALARRWPERSRSGILDCTGGCGSAHGIRHPSPSSGGLDAEAVPDDSFPGCARCNALLERGGTESSAHSASPICPVSRCPVKLKRGGAKGNDGHRLV